MKTTFDIPEELLVRAKKHAAEQRRPLKALVLEGLQAQLDAGRRQPRAKAKRSPIRWVTVAGELAPGLDVSDREKMFDWLRRNP